MGQRAVYGTYNEKEKELKITTVQWSMYAYNVMEEYQEKELFWEGVDQLFKRINVASHISCVDWIKLIDYIDQKLPYQSSFDVTYIPSDYPELYQQANTGNRGVVQGRIFDRWGLHKEERGPEKYRFHSLEDAVKVLKDHFHNQDGISMLYVKGEIPALLFQSNYLLLWEEKSPLSSEDKKNGKWFWKKEKALKTIYR